MILEIQTIYKKGKKQLLVDIIRDDKLYKNLSVDETITFILSQSNVTMVNFSIINNTYFRGKNCNLRMEVLSNEQIRLCNREQGKSNRERPIRVERGIDGKKREKSTTRHLRENNTGLSREFTNKSRRVQNVVSTGILNDIDNLEAYISKSKFKTDFDAERANTEYAPCVDTHDLEELNSMSCFGHKDLGFFAVSSDGNICSVLKSSKNRKKGYTKDIMINAIRHGGNKLDCFAIYDGGLVDYYMDVGFIPVCRVRFNPEYAPEGWKSTWGTPDVVMMMHNLDTADDILNKYSKFGTYKGYLSKHGDSFVPYFNDYDEALEYRDKRLSELIAIKYKKSLGGGINRLKSAFSKAK